MTSWGKAILITPDKAIPITLGKALLITLVRDRTHGCIFRKVLINYLYASKESGNGGNYRIDLLLWLKKPSSCMSISLNHGASQSLITKTS